MATRNSKPAALVTTKRGRVGLIKTHLRKLCEELSAWRKTGKLPDDAFFNTVVEAVGESHLVVEDWINAAAVDYVCKNYRTPTRRTADGAYLKGITHGHV